MEATRGVLLNKKTRYVIRGTGKPNDIYLIKEVSHTNDFKDNFYVYPHKLKNVLYIK